MGDDLPARYRARVLAALPGRVARLVLFGSRAKGEPHEDGDWDFAVFFTEPPSAAESRRLAEIDRDLGERFGCRVQSLEFPGEQWLASTELACNIRDHGLIIHGPTEVPRIERPVKAERFAGQAAQAVPEAYETVVHNSCHAMFHAARAALLAVEGTATTKHGRVVETFRRMVRKRRLGAGAADLAATLKQADELRANADCENVDLTEEGQQLRARVAPFFAICRELVEAAPERP